METRKIDDKFLELLEAFIRNKTHDDDCWIPPSRITAYLVGSRAKGCAKPDSDWDILVVHPMFMSIDRRIEIGDCPVYYKGDIGGGYVIDLVIVSQDDLINSKSDFVTDARKCLIKLFSIEASGDSWGLRS